MKSDSQQNSFNLCSVDVIKFGIKHWKILAIVTILAAIISIVVSSPMITPPKYKSTVILFPSTSTSISKTLLSTTGGGIKESMMQFGEEEDSERILQVINSDKIRKRIIEHFNLDGHYGILNEKTKLYNTFEKNFEFKRTKYMAIKISVMDVNAKLASDMANYAANLIDIIMNEIYKERSIKAFQIVKDEYESMRQEINSIKDSLSKISEYGIVDYESQAEVFNAAYAKAVANGNQAAMNALKHKINILEHYGSRYLFLKNLLEFETERFSEIKAKYMEAKVDAQKFIPYKYVVDNAYPADKKAYPVRWIIVSVSTLAAFLICFLALIIMHKLSSNH